MGLLPDIGFYTCMNCPHDSEDDNSIVYLGKKKKLPECPVCGYTYWMKV